MPVYVVSGSLGDMEIMDERIKELAYSRWELRTNLQWRLWETDKDDWHAAEHIARAEEKAKEAEMKNKKGFTGIEVVLAIAVIGLMAGMFLPKTVASFGDLFNGGNKNQQKQTYTVSEKYPIGTLDEKGKFVRMGDYSKSETHLNLAAQQAPEKWSTKIAIVVGILVVLAIAFPAVAVNLWLKAKANMKQIITGVQQAKINLPPASVAILESDLSKKMDMKAKAQVKKVVASIKADEISKTPTPVLPQP
jgi:competence protein ComGC